MNVRKECIQLQRLSGLEELRNNIHHFTGKEDVEIISAYQEFLKSGNIERFKQICKEYKIGLNFNKIDKSREALPKETEAVTSSLLNHLRQVWRFNPGGLRDKIDNLAKLGSVPKIKENQKLAQIFRDMLWGLKKVTISLEVNDPQNAARKIGKVRFDAQVLEKRTSGELKKEFYLLDLFLENLENQFHPEVLQEFMTKENGELKFNSFRSLTDLIKLVTQKHFSILAMYQGDPALAKDITLVEKLMETKNMKDLYDALE